MVDEAPLLVDSTHITPIVLDDAHGRWEFDPRSDMTALEAALLAQLFTVILFRRGRQDWREYLTRARVGVQLDDLMYQVCNLARHFKQVDG